MGITLGKRRINSKTKPLTGLENTVLNPVYLDR